MGENYLCFGIWIKTYVHLANVIPISPSNFVLMTNEKIKYNNICYWYGGHNWIILYQMKTAYDCSIFCFLQNPVLSEEEASSSEDGKVKYFSCFVIIMILLVGCSVLSRRFQHGSTPCCPSFTPCFIYAILSHSAQLGAALDIGMLLSVFHNVQWLGWNYLFVFYLIVMKVMSKSKW